MAEALTQSTTNEHPLPSLPKEVKLYRQDGSAGLTPRQMRAVRESFGGRSITQIEDDERLVVVAWLKLQEELGQFLVEMMDDVVIRPQIGADGQMESSPPDPTAGARSSSSSPSADSGE